MDPDNILKIVGLLWLVFCVVSGFLVGRKLHVSVKLFVERLRQTDENLYKRLLDNRGQTFLKRGHVTLRDQKEIRYIVDNFEDITSSLDEELKENVERVRYWRKIWTFGAIAMMVSVPAIPLPVTLLLAAIFL
ncbi:hypothetical protein [Halospina denitrificans]|uniref:hypothetical protein n=1 Tax=Halospina denitrificans TaxID=332522 RepID=UPI00105B3BCE|nr:hypothetical protein [Halospina denitrificans]